MILVCSNCGQKMEGTLDVLQKEIQCPTCREWACPELPRAGDFVRSHESGQSRLNDLVDAADEVNEWHNRRRRRVVRPPEAIAPPRPSEKRWYVMTTSGPKGPFCDKAIIQFAKAGKINPANRLKNAQTGAEVRAGDIPNLFPKQTRTRPQSPVSGDKPAPANDDGWYIRTSKGDAGPFTNEQVVAYARARKIKAKTMLRYGHTGRFVAADTVRGLIPATA